MQKHLLAVFLVVAILTPSITHGAAATFDPNLLMHDGELNNHTAMTATDIQAFLNEHDGILKELVLTDRDGKDRPVSHIIWRAANAAKINPQILLVLLQKEQSLIERGRPTMKALDWALGYGVCDTCDLNDPRLRQFKGFATQLYGAATRIRDYIDRPQKYGWIKKGRPFVVSGLTVIPKTDATRALYLYTPHIASAKTFWNLWTRYFGKPYPDGTVLHDTTTDTTWRIENGTRRAFASKAIAASMMDERFILDVPHTVLANYPEGAPITIANYSLVKTPKGSIYLIVDSKKRLIPSESIFKSLGYNPEELIAVKDADLKGYQNGPPITSNSDTPQGSVYENTETGARYLVTAGVKHPITSQAILSATIPNATIIPVSSRELSRYIDGPPVRFPSGTLIARTNGALAVVSGGKRQEFGSIDIAITLGYTPKRAIIVDDAIWNLHPEGEAITVPPPDADPEGIGAQLAQSKPAQ